MTRHDRRRQWARRNAPPARAASACAPAAASSARHSVVSVFRRPGTLIPCQPGKNSYSQRYGIQPRRAVELEAEREHGEREHAERQGGAAACAAARRSASRRAPGRRSRGPETASSQRRSPSPSRTGRRRVAPHAAEARRGEELIRRAGERGDVLDRALRLGMVVQHAQVGAREHDGDRRRSRASRCTSPRRCCAAGAGDRAATT